MNGINQLVVNGRAEGSRIASGIQHNGSAGSRAGSVNAYQIGAPVGKLVRARGVRSSVNRERLDAFDENQRIVPPIIQRFA